MYQLSTVLGSLVSLLAGTIEFLYKEIKEIPFGGAICLCTGLGGTDMHLTSCLVVRKRTLCEPAAACGAG